MHDIYLSAVHLAAALAPAQPSGSWYREAVQAIQTRRYAFAAEEAQVWHKRREPIMAKLATRLAPLTSEAVAADADFCKVPGSLQDIVTTTDCDL